MKNITTATAMTSNGLPAPAGLSTGRNSDLLQATLPGGCAASSATRCCSTTCSGTTAPAPGPAAAWRASARMGDPSPSSTGTWASAGGSGELSPDLLAAPGALRRGRSHQHGGVKTRWWSCEYDAAVRVFPWRGNTNFVGADIVAIGPARSACWATITWAAAHRRSTRV